MSATHKARMTPEIRAKLSAAHKGVHPTPETRAKMTASQKGRHHTPETRARMSAATRLQMTPEHRARLSAAAKRRPPITPETRAKMSAARKGRKLTPEHCTKMSAAHRGLKHTPEARAKISAGHKGEKNPNWLGGISFAPYAWAFNNELKAEVRRRDGHKCQLCGVPQVECKRLLDIHHIDYDKTNSDPVNLVALCMSCHRRTGANRLYWRAYFAETERSE